MALLQQWRDMAYDQQADKAKLQQFWAIYFTKEKDIYAELLKNPDELVRGTVKELAEKFGVDIMTMTGFLDGINDSLKAPNPIEEMEEEAARQRLIALYREIVNGNLVKLHHRCDEFVKGLKFIVPTVLLAFVCYALQIVLQIAW